MIFVKAKKGSQMLKEIWSFRSICNTSGLMVASGLIDPVIIELIGLRWPCNICKQDLITSAMCVWILLKGKSTEDNLLRNCSQQLLSTI